METLSGDAYSPIKHISACGDQHIGASVRLFAYQVRPQDRSSPIDRRHHASVLIILCKEIAEQSVNGDAGVQRNHPRR